MKIGILGVGNMGKAIIEGLKNVYDAKDIYAMNPVNPKVAAFQSKIGFNLYSQYVDLEKNHLDVLIVTTPAPITVQILSHFTDLSSDTIIISAAAGVKIVSLKQALPNNPIAEIIPNIPVTVNRGTIGATLSDLTEKQQEVTVKLLSSLGDVIPVHEYQLPIIGTLSGCGPAFVDVFMDAMGDAAVENGLNRHIAHKVIASMVAGSGSMLYQSNHGPVYLKDLVTSPGGSTIKGVNMLERCNFRRAVIDAVNKANDYNR